MMKSPQASGRIEAFDYLRGYFIIVIVIDHLYRWPSFLSLITGQGMLWSNAADGFLIISGLLVGYIRGYKSLHLPFTAIAQKLARRAGMLYLWSVGLSIALVLLQWAFVYRFPMPNVDASTGDWWELILGSVTLAYAHPWIYFLHLYAIFMLLAIGIVWLLHHRLAWAAIIVSLLGLLVGNLTSIEWLEKQSLFLIPAIAGYSIDHIRHAVMRLSSKKQTRLTYSIIGFTGVTVTLSVLWRFAPDLFSTNTYEFIEELFRRQPMGFGATAIAFVWFIGLFALFNQLLPLLKRYTSWLILPFGQRSLAGYILHCIPLLITSYFFATSDNVWFNTALGIASIFTVLILLRVPVVRRIMPQ